MSIRQSVRFVILVTSALTVAGAAFAGPRPMRGNSGIASLETSRDAGPADGGPGYRDAFARARNDRTSSLSPSVARGGNGAGYRDASVRFGSSSSLGMASSAEHLLGAKN